MSGKGVKRASPGADEEKNPLGDVDITDEDAVKLQDLQKYYHRVELAVGASFLRLIPVQGSVLTMLRALQSVRRPRRWILSTKSVAQS